MESNNEDPYTQAFILRLDASAARKKALFFIVLAVVAGLSHIAWLVVVLSAIVAVLLAISIALNGEAKRLWPQQKETKKNEKRN